jgi:hypothetical protein
MFADGVQLARSPVGRQRKHKDKYQMPILYVFPSVEITEVKSAAQ